MKLFIWVQHLFGVGHARRMARIAEACGADGMDVTVAAGGPGGANLFRGLTNVSARQLPPLKTRDAEYSGLLTEANTAPDDTYWAARQKDLIAELNAAQSDVLLIELFPFGRRKFAREVLALIHAARALPTHPLIISSVRDVVEPKNDPNKTAEMAGWLKAHFDAVLVHGDESVLPLTATAPFVADAGVPLHYTGYVAPDVTDTSPPAGKAGVVVSAGSGASGAKLLAVANAVAKDHALRARPWHIFVPPGVKAPSSGNPYAHIHPFSPDFTSYLARAEVSVGEAGYNTTLEALALGARPVLVPYVEAGQTEQPTRAKAFARAGLAAYLPAKDLNPMMLLSTVEAARSLAPATSLNLSGAKHASLILKGLRQDGVPS